MGNFLQGLEEMQGECVVGLGAYLLDRLKRPI